MVRESCSVLGVACCVKDSNILTQMRDTHSLCNSSELTAFDHQPRTRIVFGVGSVDRVGTLARELGARKVLLVTDAGIAAAGHADRVQATLNHAGLQVTVFDKAKENPTSRCVDDCLSIAKSAGIDTVIGLGGGSSM